MNEQKDNKKTISIDNNNIDRILKFIHERPTCHLRQIKKELIISMGTAQHHLYKLEKNGQITTTSLINEYKDGKFKRYKLNIDSKYLITLMKNYYPII